MVKPKEIKQVWQHNKFHAALMVYTAVLVIFTSFLTGVLSALVIYGVFYRKFESAEPLPAH
jgi:SulP family sulfate permease